MTDEEIKAEALKHGYRLCKIPCHDCSCYMPYPNISHKNKNGAWKCVDRYRPIEDAPKTKWGPITKCVKK